MQENVHLGVILAAKTTHPALAELRIFAALCALTFSYQTPGFFLTRNKASILTKPKNKLSINYKFSLYELIS